MNRSNQNNLWCILEDSGDNFVDVANLNFMSPCYSSTYTSPLSQLSSSSVDSGMEIESHNHESESSCNAINIQQQQIINEASETGQNIFNRVPTLDYQCFNNSINTEWNQNLLVDSEQYQISYPSESSATVFSHFQDAKLKIIEEPKTIFRFRYETEMQGPHGMIQARQHNKNQKVFPTVALQGFDCSSTKVVIKCALYQYEANGEFEEVGHFHPHKLVASGSDNEKFDPHYHEVSKQNNYTAVFQKLGIIQTKRNQMKEIVYQKLKAEIEYEYNRKLSFDELQNINERSDELVKKININQVRLGYTAFAKDHINNNWKKICGPVFSTVINNKKNAKVGDLKICRMSTYFSEANGNQEVFLFVSKVDKNTIKVRFFETIDGDPDSEEIVWNEYGQFSPNDVHHQFGIVLRTPQYKKLDIKNDVKVYIQLYRTSDSEKSEAKEFIYKPNSGHSGIKRKCHQDDHIFPTVIKNFESSVSSSSSFGNFSTIAKPTSDTNQQSCSHGSTINEDEHQEEIEQVIKFWVQLENLDTSIVNNMTDGEFTEYCNKLTTDAVEPYYREEDTSFSLLTKLKFIHKHFGYIYCKKKIHEMMMELIQTAEATEENILISVIKEGNFNEIKELLYIIVKYKLHEILTSKNEVNQNVLHLVTLTGHTNLLSIFVNLGADINHVDAFGSTPLHLAVARNSIAMIQEILKFKESTFVKLNLDVLDDGGCTPLILSVLNNNLDILMILIKAGANVSKQNPGNGFTCLHVAVNNKVVNMEMIKYLININETNLYVESNQGQNILDLAVANNINEDIIKYLSAYYDNDDIDKANKKEVNEEEEEEEENEFDEQCLIELSAIFDKNDKWKIWIMRMDLCQYEKEWVMLESPSRALLEYLINAKKTVENFIDLLELADDNERDCAINSIDEMLVRKYNK